MQFSLSEDLTVEKFMATIGKRIKFWGGEIEYLEVKYYLHNFTYCLLHFFSFMSIGKAIFISCTSLLWLQIQWLKFSQVPLYFPTFYSFSKLRNNFMWNKIFWRLKLGLYKLRILRLDSDSRLSHYQKDGTWIF